MRLCENSNLRFVALYFILFVTRKIQVPFQSCFFHTDSEYWEKVDQVREMASDEVKLTDRFREQNRQVHRESDALVNLKLVAAMSDIRLYRQALIFFYTLFHAIEAALYANRELDVVRPMYECVKRVSRVTRFEEDLAFYSRRSSTGKAESLSVDLPASVDEYVAHIEKLASGKESAYLVLAYAYTMHQAILGGGQILKKMLKKGLGLDANDRGVAIFCLGESESPSSIQQELRDIMNLHVCGQLSAEQQNLLCLETKQVFIRNNRMVRDIQDVGLIVAGKLFKYIAGAIFLLVSVYLVFIVARQ